MFRKIIKKLTSFKQKLFNTVDPLEISIIETAVTCCEIPGHDLPGQPINILSEIRVDLSRLSEVNDMLDSAGDKIVRKFALSGLTLLRLGEADDEAVEIYHRNETEPARNLNTIRLSEWLTEKCLQKLQAGQEITINQIKRSRQYDNLEMLVDVDVQSQIMVPYISNGMWKFLLVAQTQPHSWSSDDLKLLFELTELLFQQLELAYAEEALKSSETWLRLAIEAANVFTWDIDLVKNEMRTSANAAEIRGFPVEPTVERFFRNVHPDDLNLLVEKLYCSYDRAKPFEVEFREVNPLNGDVIWLQMKGRFVLTKGAANRVIGVTHNITASKQTEEALKESEERYRILAGELRTADRRKDEFLGILSHEIRNPLASIMLCLSLLDRSAPGGEQSRQAREVMGRQLDQLSRLIDDILDVTRITRNMIVLQKEQVELNEIVRRTVEDYQALFQEKKVDLLVNLAPVALHIHADPTRLSQIIGNLLHNAAKFTGKGCYTRVSVSGDQKRQCAVICVQDNGIGIEADIMPNLFMPFMQADSSLNHRSGGLGLGLALVRGLSELHGGSVSAHSDGPGKGSRFEVNLPLAVALSRVKKNKPVSAAPRRSRRVLIIEDIYDVAEMLSSLLSEEGHEVAVAHDGFEGIAKAKEFHPEILLCDIGLPGMDGYQVARAFGEDEDLKDVYMISLTGYARLGDQKKSKEAGFHSHLSKPVSPAKLQETLIQAT